MVAERPPPRRALTYSSPPRPRNSASTCPSSPSRRPPPPRLPCSCPERTPQMLVRRIVSLARLLLTPPPHRHSVTSLRCQAVVTLLGILDSRPPQLHRLDSQHFPSPQPHSLLQLDPKMCRIHFPRLFPRLIMVLHLPHRWE